ncbi:hypothetical protein L1049_013622 [Liquidambar formosana]|uniref:C2 NT-type domain-containing protein n=1 Tax=Liquidambar formosana TaxID=63359 RepID=A0AAP0WYE4_LIQFO
MMKWSPWPPVVATKKFLVKVKPLKLEGLKETVGKEETGSKKEKVTAIEMRWKGPKPGLVPFHLSSKRQRNFSSERFVRRGESIKWDGDDEFESVCSFSIVPKDDSFDRWDASFRVLYGENAESRSKLAVVGKISLNLAELAWKMEPRIERKLPITLQVSGVAIEASLTVSVSFVEIRSSQDSPEMAQNLTQSNKEEGFLRWVTGRVSFVDKKKPKNKVKMSLEDEVSARDSDGSATFDSEELLKKESITMTHDSNAEAKTGTELGLSPSSETQLDPVQKVGFWKRRRLSWTKGEPLINKTSGDNDKKTDVERQLNNSSTAESNVSGSTQGAYASKPSKSDHPQHENCITTNWEVKELVSRDGQAKLKANVFFASFDQRSQQAAGENACTAVAAVIAHWLQSNHGIMPTRSEFDSLITEGSSQWRKLCNNKAYLDCFPDEHFDLETVLQADLRPLAVLREKSFVGFFSPEKFESLKETMSFDKIWDEINSNIDNYEPRIYIVSWNDHFFVLKVESDAYYIIDSLGERLFEGCNQGYILKFDHSALMYGKPEKEEISSEATDQKEERQEIVCTGKECCREFLKRFLAAIPLRELEVDEKKGRVCNFSLHQRLQIEFHYTFSSSSSSSSSVTSVTSSLFSNEDYLTGVA